MSKQIRIVFAIIIGLVTAALGLWAPQSSLAQGTGVGLMPSNTFVGNTSPSEAPPAITSFGISVNNPGTGTPEALLPVVNVTSPSDINFTLFTKTARSNAGSPMTDTLPASTVEGMANGTRLNIANVDSAASDTISAGAGTTILGGSSFVLSHGRDVLLVYDKANTNWISDANSASFDNLLPGSAVIYLAGYADSINANSVADTAITIKLPAGVTNYRIDKIIIENTGTTASLTAAQFGIFSAVSGGGTSIYATGTALTGLTSNAVNTGVSVLSFTGNTNAAWNYTTLYFRITQAQSAAATINVYIWIDPLP